MQKKNKSGLLGVVYSTNPNFQYEREEEIIPETLNPGEQKLLIQLDHKNRGGKTVTLITGFIGTSSDLDALAKNLRNFCGTGGSAKDGEAIVQGDQREKVMQWLLKHGYSKTRKK